MDKLDNTRSPSQTLETLFESALCATTHGRLPDSFDRAICAFVDERKARGDRIEGVIIELKQIADRAAATVCGQASLAGTTRADVADTVRQPISLCVRRYYEAEPRNADFGSDCSAGTETRIRNIYGGGLPWRVRETLYDSLDRRATTSLIFDSDFAVRRVRGFPTNWFDSSGDDLYAMSLGK